MRSARPRELLDAAQKNRDAPALQARPYRMAGAEAQAIRAGREMIRLDEAQRAAIEEARVELGESQEALAAAGSLLEALGTAEDDDAVTQALADYLDIPADDVTFTGNMYTAVLARLVVATDIVTETMIAEKSIKAPHLDIVYEDPTTGYGFALRPEGLTILSAEGQPVVTLRADGSIRLGVLGLEGEVLAAMDEAGDVVGQTVHAVTDVTVAGSSLIEALNRLPGAGQVPPTLSIATLGETGIINNNPTQILLAEITLPGTGPRQIEIDYNIDATTRSGTPIRLWSRLFILGYDPTGNFPGPGRQTRGFARAITSSTQHRDQHPAVYSVASNNIPSSTPGFAPTLNGGDRCWVLLAADVPASGSEATVHSGQTYLTVRDGGQAVAATEQTSDTPPAPPPPEDPDSGGGGGTVIRTPQNHVVNLSRSNTRPFHGNGSLYQDLARPRWHAYQGNGPAISGGRSVMWIGDLSSVLAGRTINHVDVQLQVVQGGAGTVTPEVGVLSQSSIPSSLPNGASGWAAGLVSRSGAVGSRIGFRLPSSVHAGIASGSTRMITISGFSSGAGYAVIDPAASRLIVNFT